MNIKSLLLGSAAALTVVSGAQAADAIMAAAPEPVEYVRVCDAFGTGYFYIPGTETCLKISGYMRVDVKGGDLLGLDANGDGDGDSWSTRARFTFRTDTKSDTELGVLHTYTETRFNFDNGVSGFDSTGDTGDGTSVSLNFGYIELGGFRVGKTESEFTRLAFYGNGYAGGVIQDTLVGYGPFDATQISYTYTSPSGFVATLALEDDNAGSDDSRTTSSTVFALDPATGVVAPVTTTTTVPEGNYIPDVIAGLGYKGGAFGLAVVGAYDESLSAGAVKVRADATFGRVSAFLMGGWSSNGDETGEHGCTVSSVTSCGSNHYAVWGGDWAIWGGLSADLTEKIGSNIQLSYDDDQNFGAAANLVFHVVPGFDVTTEVDYADAGDDSRNRPAFIDVDQSFGGMVRFQRSF